MAIKSQNTHNHPQEEITNRIKALSRKEQRNACVQKAVKMKWYASTKSRPLPLNVKNERQGNHKLEEEEDRQVQQQWQRKDGRKQMVILINGKE